MILTHEQAHTAHKIMLLALEGGADGANVSFSYLHAKHAKDKGVRIWEDYQAGTALRESHDTLADFAAAYDVAGTAQRHEYTKAAQSWLEFRTYHAMRGAPDAPCTREQFERLSVAGRVTKMTLGLWA